MSVPLPPGAGIENIDPDQIKTVRRLTFYVIMLIIIRFLV